MFELPRADYSKVFLGPRKSRDDEDSEDSEEDQATNDRFFSFAAATGEGEGDKQSDSARDEDVASENTEEAKLKPLIDIQVEVLDALMGNEYDPAVGTACKCGEGVCSFRCVDCARVRSMCRTCIVRCHAQSPYHWIEQWTGSFFKRMDLSDIGLRIHLGHQGAPCPHAAKDGCKMQVTDTNGIHTSVVVYCACRDKESTVSQLLKHALFPSSVKQPDSAFTLQVLRDFHILTTVAKTSAYDYMESLHKKTNNVVPHAVTPPRQQFSRISWYWRFLVSLRRSGQLYSIDDNKLCRPSGSLAVQCLACPLPGFNTDFNIEDNYRNRKFMSADANFHLIGLKKRNNEGEEALWAGHGYIRKQEDLDQHIIRHRGKLQEEKSTCSNFQAIEKANSLKHRGQNVSGLAMVLCRHEMAEPEGAVNLQLGERYINMDYALAGALQGKGNINSIILSYDIGCQYYKNLHSRFRACFPELVKTVQKVSVRVGKLHLFGHEDQCQYGFSLNYTDGVGRTDGEECERLWSEYNQAAGSTKQMGRGHRCDTIDDITASWNWRKLTQLANTLAKRYIKSCQECEEFKAQFNATDIAMRRTYKNALVRQWEEMNTAPFKNGKGEWDSAFRCKVSYPTRAKVLAIYDAPDACDPTKKLRGRLINFIALGISLQIQQAELRSSGCNVSEKASEAFDRCCRSFRLQQDTYMSSIPDLAESRGRNGLDGNILLPSSYTNFERVKFGLEELAKFEYELREADAFNALHSLKMALREVAYQVSRYGSEGPGKKNNTRSVSLQKRAHDAKRKHASQYRIARNALISLGMDNANSTLRPLTEQDMYRPSVQDPHELGSGKKKLGWIWSLGCGTQKNKDWVQEEDRVLWLRSRATRDRWLEEVTLLETEFRRLLQGLKSMWATWDNLSRHAKLVGYASFAARRAFVFCQMHEHASDLFSRMIDGAPKYLWLPRSSLDAQQLERSLQTKHHRKRSRLNRQ